MTDEDFAGGTGLGPEDRDVEAPDADVLEQAAVADPADRDADVVRDPEVSEWDAVEQAQVVDLSDEY